jgi:hypothetical protein
MAPEMRVNVLHNPFRRWVPGIVIELLAFLGFLAAVASIVAVVIALL